VKVVWTETAVKHLTAIHEYVAQTSPLYAELLVRRLWDRTGQLAAFRSPVVQYLNPIAPMCASFSNGPIVSSIRRWPSELKCWRSSTPGEAPKVWRRPEQGGPSNKRLEPTRRMIIGMKTLFSTPRGSRAIR